jgi:hypothetical protein
MDGAVLDTLRRKTEAVVPAQGNWQIAYVGMARGGWAKDAQTMASSMVTDEEGNGRHWRICQTMLVDLAEIDEDLSNWSG